MPRINDREWRKERQAEAKTRKAHREVRTPQQQLQELDKRLGVLQGASKERQRLHALIAGVK